MESYLLTWHEYLTPMFTAFSSFRLVSSHRDDMKPNVLIFAIFSWNPLIKDPNKQTQSKFSEGLDWVQEKLDEIQFVIFIELRDPKACYIELHFWGEIKGIKTFFLLEARFLLSGPLVLKYSLKKYYSGGSVCVSIHSFWNETFWKLISVRNQMRFERPGG